MSTTVQPVPSPRSQRLQLQAVSNALAMQDYRKTQQEARQKTAKLRELRLAREAEQARLAAEAPKTPAKSKKRAIRK